ncbi:MULTISPECIES: 5-methyltetrahydropteroyltriglutamate--homocysteine methyltransferase [Halolamina]|uniref:5-methyltetrahydropteroyltriglutamate--homocysteine methyltransferase n=1 Tax=Halolamina pelagica TaxID=699431 RepID=A0A1I5QA78_9EURY|nr:MULTISPECIES: 5-methyltetrahydropteroyltriglutamate--homocysteine methyltransferase [Halolamina]NHX35174.1 5-methyltetrahydropteroyltriglutamate--homocysteine methyltransferase [Halolamina sp. R1-12]SFP43208.1 5-methyltetrahydropteroyltriglutamate--homocysteine methyltransferase [Halolamina pelagica]
MTDRVATTLGLYPLPDWAKDELSNLKGHQKADLVDGSEGPEVRAAYERVREDLIDDQREAGLDRVVEGQGRWDDWLAHPLAVHEGVETGGIVRYYDNNNFYRDPRVVDELTPDGDVAAELDAATGLLNEGDSLQAVLPGPYTLAELATDEHYGDEADFLAAIAEFLAAEVEALPPHETLFLLDPSLVTDSPEDDANERVSDAVDTVAAATDADVVLQSYWGAHAEKTYAHLMDADFDAFGFDFVAGDRDAHLYNVTEFGTKDDVSLGLVDGQNTAVESPETVAERIDWVTEQVPSQTFDTVYATPNTELAYLPVSTYREKLSVLADGVDLAPETEVSA